MIVYLYHRNAAPRKGRPEQWRARLSDGTLVDLSQGRYDELVAATANYGQRAYNGFVRLADDEAGQAKWFCWRLARNDLTA